MSGKIHPPSTRVEGKGLTNAVAGDDTHFTVLAHDAFGNRKETGHDRVDVMFEVVERAVSEDDEEDRLRLALRPGVDKPPHVQDKENGTYVVTYVKRQAVQYRMTVEFNQVEIEGSPFNLTVQAAAICAKTRCAK